MTSGGEEEGSRKEEANAGFNPAEWTQKMPAYNDGEMDEEKDGEKDALAELAHTEQRERPK